MQELCSKIGEFWLKSDQRKSPVLTVLFNFKMRSNQGRLCHGATGLWSDAPFFFLKDVSSLRDLVHLLYSVHPVNTVYLLSLIKQMKPQVQNVGLCANVYSVCFWNCQKPFPSKFVTPTTVQRKHSLTNKQISQQQSYKTIKRPKI